MVELPRKLPRAVLAAFALAGLLAQPVLAGAIPVCAGSQRAERKLTCIVDGDTGWERGVKWRAIGGDTPEIGRAGCARERRLGETARDRLRELMAGGYDIEWAGRTDYYRRQLATVRLADGRDAVQVLVEDGLARSLAEPDRGWCDR